MIWVSLCDTVVAWQAERPAVEGRPKKCCSIITTMYVCTNLLCMCSILIVSQEMCDIDVCTNENQTALHLAVHQGHFCIVERLVGYGANLNIQDINGDTPLHIALVRDNADVLNSESPQLRRVSM